jgi:hypothetical protein
MTFCSWDGCCFQSLEMLQMHDWLPIALLALAGCIVGGVLVWKYFWDNFYFHPGVKA